MTWFNANIHPKLQRDYLEKTRVESRLHTTVLVPCAMDLNTKKRILKFQR